MPATRRRPSAAPAPAACRRDPSARCQRVGVLAARGRESGEDALRRGVSSPPAMMPSYASTATCSRWIALPRISASPLSAANASRTASSSGMSTPRRPRRRTRGPADQLAPVALERGDLRRVGGPSAITMRCARRRPRTNAAGTGSSPSAAEQHGDVLGLVGDDRAAVARRSPLPSFGSASMYAAIAVFSSSIAKRSTSVLGAQAREVVGRLRAVRLAAGVLDRRGEPVGVLLLLLEEELGDLQQLALQPPGPGLVGRDGHRARGPAQS